MKEENIALEKSYKFAIRTVKLYQYLTREKREYVLSKQVLRSGTSIGSNIEEAVGGFSRKDFLAKISIAYKEARETKYWLRLLSEGGYLEKSFFESIFQDCDELCKILAQTLITCNR
ncbi:MAG TPA: four helix bundle protein [Candidatus Nanoarchaeia archaeon]|nr:four helix bundle protein [Candidatus Nanoarchaeia archaeon]